jgi:hypothetical protein
MQDEDNIYFALLKNEIAARLQQTIPGISSSIESWKGQDIIHFQEDLAIKVNGRISEKWFYTHVKLRNNKLPRIDILNLLSKYCGYNDWTDFKLNNGHRIESFAIKKFKTKNILFWSFSLVIILTIGFALYTIFGPKTFHFCFVDADKKTPIINQSIQIVLLYEGESPVYMQCNSGCFTLKTARQKIRFVVKTPYYKTDTITRVLNNYTGGENIHLQTNDYALMIYYFSRSKKVDWEKRRKQLDYMMAENARIYQVYDDEKVGMELYNKREFINKLTMPVQSLKNIEIIETIYTGNKISLLRFRQTQQ